MLAENEEGYRNLIRLTIEASLHGFYRKPRVSKKYLAETCEGADLAFRLPERGAVRGAHGRATTSRPSGGRSSIRTFLGKGNFFLEIQDQGLEAGEEDSEAICSGWKGSWRFRWWRPTTRTTCAARTAHAHEVMLCVQTGAKIHDAERFKFDSDQFFVKSADEMARLFKDSPAVLTRTMEIAERCNLKLHKVDNPFPEFAVPEGHTIDSYFEEVCREGFKKRLETSMRQLEASGRAAHADP